MPRSKRIVRAPKQFYPSSWKAFKPSGANRGIPRVVWKTGPTPVTGLSHGILGELERLHNQNYAVVYMDNRDAESFLKTAFHDDVCKAFGALIPGAYKADLLRYCLMYKYGGIYSDLHQIITVPLDTLLSGRDALFVKDINEPDVQISLMACPPRKPCFGKAIAQIVLNVQHQRYGANYLDLTGPSLFGKLVTIPSKGLKQIDHWNIHSADGELVVKCHELECKFTSGAYSTLWTNREAIRDTSDHVYANWAIRDIVCPLRDSRDGPGIPRQIVTQVMASNNIPTTSLDFQSNMSLYHFVRDVAGVGNRKVGACVAVMMAFCNNYNFCEHTLPRLVRNVTASLHARKLRPTFYFYDNSSDDTLAALERTIGDVHIASEPFPLKTAAACGARTSARCNRISACRNALIGMAMPTLVRSRFAIMIDSNVYADSDTLSRLINFSESRDDVGMVTACTLSSTSPTHYYDTYAYAPIEAGPSWNYESCPMMHCTRKECVRTKGTLKLDDPPVEVKSAFGGLGVIKSAALLHAGWLSENNQCEHVAFCKQLRDQGLRIFILPRARAQWTHTYYGHAHLVAPMTRELKLAKTLGGGMRRAARRGKRG